MSERPNISYEAAEHVAQYIEARTPTQAAPWPLGPIARRHEWTKVFETLVSRWPAAHRTLVIAHLARAAGDEGRRNALFDVLVSHIQSVRIYCNPPSMFYEVLRPLLDAGYHLSQREIDDVFEEATKDETVAISGMMALRGYIPNDILVERHIEHARAAKLTLQYQRLSQSRALFESAKLKLAMQQERESRTFHPTPMVAGGL